MPIILLLTSDGVNVQYLETFFVPKFHRDKFRAHYQSLLLLAIPEVLMKPKCTAFNINKSTDIGVSR